MLNGEGKELAPAALAAFLNLFAVSSDESKNKDGKENLVKYLDYDFDCDVISFRIEIDEDLITLSKSEEDFQQYDNSADVLFLRAMEMASEMLLQKRDEIKKRVDRDYAAYQEEVLGDI